MDNKEILEAVEYLLQENKKLKKEVEQLRQDVALLKKNEEAAPRSGQTDGSLPSDLLQ